MDKIIPSKIANLRELVGLLSTSVMVQGEVADILEEISAALYSLDQDRTRLIADYRVLQDRCNSLEKRYSELLYQFSVFKKDSDK